LLALGSQMVRDHAAAIATCEVVAAPSRED
jgi:hypothetical protein